MEISLNTPVGEIVRENFITADVFRKNNIDFCCNGHRTIGEVCTENKINSAALIDELHQLLKSKENPALNVESWPLSMLTYYIQEKHHKYVEEAIPVLKMYLSKICDVHGNSHPELFEVKTIFEHATDELTVHMKKEELILFPYINRISDATQQHTSLGAAPFGSVENPIGMMKHEHNAEGDYFRKISALTNTYTPPADACNTYKVTFELLRQFEEDLHTHIHLENNILFLKAIEEEKELVKD